MTYDLLQLIEEFLVDTQESASRFGWLAAHNGRLVERLRRNEPILTRTDAKVRAYIAEQRANPRRRNAKSATEQVP